MTPLAGQFALQLTLPIKDRHYFITQNNTGDFLRSFLGSARFFECSAIIDMAFDISKQLSDLWGNKGIDGYAGLTFLPAPSVWLEFKLPQMPSRSALILQEGINGQSAVAALATAEGGEFCIEHMGYLSLDGGKFRTTRGMFEQTTADMYRCIKTVSPNDDNQIRSVILMAGQALLACINSPKIIGTRQQMPHRKVERELIKAFGPGKFPLHAWTELQLKVAKPVEIDDGEPHEAHLTGRRALHFCRKHIRIRRGKLEYVSAHWRGDAAIGIKQTRYRVSPDRQALQS